MHTVDEEHSRQRAPCVYKGMEVSKNPDVR